MIDAGEARFYPEKRVAVLNEIPVTPIVLFCLNFGLDDETFDLRVGGKIF